MRTIALVEDRPAAEILSGSFNRAQSAPESVTLTPARDRLRQAITRVASLQREAAAAAEPVQRSEAVESEAQQLHAQKCKPFTKRAPSRC
jgi:hypothetical protein